MTPVCLPRWLAVKPVVSSTTVDSLIEKFKSGFEVRDEHVYVCIYVKSDKNGQLEKEYVTPIEARSPVEIIEPY